jgi:hypothetical protein
LVVAHVPSPASLVLPFPQSPSPLPFAWQPSFLNAPVLLGIPALPSLAVLAQDVPDHHALNQNHKQFLILFIDILDKQHSPQKSAIFNPYILLSDFFMIRHKKINW